MVFLTNIETSFAISGFTITNNRQMPFQEQDYIPGNNDYSSYPGFLQIIGDSVSYSQRGDLVKYNILCYKDRFHAIKKWLSIPKLSETDRRLGCVTIFLPNFKARISSLKIENEKFLVFVEGAKKIIESLQCQVVLDSDDEEVQQNKNFEGKKHVGFNIKDEPKSLYLQLVTPNDEKIDCYEETPYRHSGNIRMLKRESDIGLLNKIENGENEIIEFKPFIQKGDSKEEEIIETVIAFSNTKGGSIIFGISDNAEIKGVSASLLKGRKIEDFLSDYKKGLRKKVSDKLNKGVDLSFKEANMADSWILEMVIAEGADKPYCTCPDNKWFVRKGANNVRPDPTKSTQ